MTAKPDSVSTLEYHWTDHTWRPLEPQVHWDATGTTLVDASNRLCSSGDPVLICIIGTHWKTTGRPLKDHSKHTGYQQFFLQWHSSVHWGLSSRYTGLPLEYHWLRLRDSTCIHYWHMTPYHYFFATLLRGRNIQTHKCLLSEAVFRLWLNMFLTNNRWWYICNMG